MNIEDDVHITRVQMARVKCYIYILYIYTHNNMYVYIYRERSPQDSGGDLSLVRNPLILGPWGPWDSTQCR